MSGCWCHEWSIVSFNLILCWPMTKWWSTRLLRIILLCSTLVSNRLNITNLSTKIFTFGIRHCIRIGRMMTTIYAISKRWADSLRKKWEDVCHERWFFCSWSYQDSFLPVRRRTWSFKRNCSLSNAFPSWDKSIFQAKGMMMTCDSKRYRSKKRFISKQFLPPRYFDSIIPLLIHVVERAPNVHKFVVVQVSTIVFVFTSLFEIWLMGFFCPCRIFLHLQHCWYG